MHQALERERRGEEKDSFLLLSNLQHALSILKIDVSLNPTTQLPRFYPQEMIKEVQCKFFMTTYYVSGPVLRTLHALTYLILSTF
jgi:hypothetical protein